MFSDITGKVSSARFFSVLEDKKRNMRFGSIGSGVSYYDGKSFQNFTTRDGLVNNEITCIYEDKTGNIWFGVNGGASCYDGKSFRNYMMNGDFMIEDRTGKTFPDFTRPPNEVNSIIEDKTGKFWFATRGNTFVYDGKTFTVFTHNGKPFSNVRSIIEDKKGNIWTSSKSENGQGWALSRYDEKSLPDKKPTVTKIIDKPMIFGILEDDKGNIWFGADGVYRYDGNTITNFKGKGDQE